MNTFTKRIETRLEAQKQAALYRRPPLVQKREGKYLYIDNEKVLNFASNDYLGLGVSETLKNRVARNFAKYSSSSSSSRLVSGNYSVISQAEKEYAQYFGYEDALFFPSGYQANMGVLSTLFEKGDIIIFDKHIHASSVKGMTMSKGMFKGYNHNDMSHLKRRLEACREKQVSVLTESVFSMDGDMLDIHAFGKLKFEYGFLSIVDEAHSFGVLGDKGQGIASEVADVAVGTFGKALGLFGAFALMPTAFKAYLFNFCSPLIYSTTLPEAHAASAMDVLGMFEQSRSLREDLKDLSRYMKYQLNKNGFQISGDGHILAIHMGKEAKAAAVATQLMAKGIYVLPARFPTVPLNKAILRISLTALHTEEDVDGFVKKLTECE